MKTGRNAPCPCGSGKKYKQCCLAAETDAAHSPEELARRRIRREMERFPASMMALFDEAYGDDALDEAWGDFVLWNDEMGPFDPDSPYVPMFMPWLFHSWAPDPAETDVADVALHGVRPTELYLERKGARLAPVLREYLASCLAHPPSFYEVEHCDPGRGLVLRDVLTGECHEVLDRAASRMTGADELLFAQLASAAGVTLLEVLGPVALPPVAKVEVIDLRKDMQRDEGRIDRETVRAWGEDVRELYLTWAEHLQLPSLPRLQTTDGEDLEFHKLVFGIDSAQETFDALKHLDILMTEEALLEGAGRGDDGRLQRVELTWAKAGNHMHKHWDNTVLGRIEIDGNRLVVQVNSRERAEAFRQLAADRLGARARLRLDEIQSTEQMFAQSAGATAPPDMPEADEALDALLAEQIERHYDAWVDTALPALGGLTPREAARDADGREQVEALVSGIERHARTSGQPVDDAVFRRMRERLSKRDAGAG